MTLKEEFWKDGYIFRMSNNTYRMVWGDKLIDAHGYISANNMSDELWDKDSAMDEHVIEIYECNYNAGYFKELIKPTTLPIWTRYDNVFTIDEIKEKLGIDKDKQIIIVK